MKTSADFKRIALNSLKGKWIIAVIAGLVVSLLGGSNGTLMDFDINLSGQETATIENINPEAIMDSGLGTFLSGVAVYILIAALVLAVVLLIIGSIVDVGYARFNLDLVDGNPVSIGGIFSYTYAWKTTLCARLWQGLYILLWSLLFIIPGIVAAYNYAMTNYILAEHPDMAPREAIRRSKEMMYGHRVRLFSLGISFIGWSILAALTLGIGNLFLSPYINAATAAFYREVSGTENSFPDFEPLEIYEEPEM